MNERKKKQIKYKVSYSLKHSLPLKAEVDVNSSKSQILILQNSENLILLLDI